MTDSLTLHEDAQYILQRELAAIAGSFLVSHQAMIPKYVDDNMHEYSEEAERILKEIIVCQH